MDIFTSTFLQAARELAIDLNGYIVLENGSVLRPETKTLVVDTEEFNRQQLIDQALREGNRDAFMKLTVG